MELGSLVSPWPLPVLHSHPPSIGWHFVPSPSLSPTSAVALVAAPSPPPSPSLPQHEPQSVLASPATLPPGTAPSTGGPEWLAGAGGSPQPPPALVSAQQEAAAAAAAVPPILRPRPTPPVVAATTTADISTIGAVGPPQQASWPFAAATSLPVVGRRVTAAGVRMGRGVLFGTKPRPLAAVRSGNGGGDGDGVGEIKAEEKGLDEASNGEEEEGEESSGDEAIVAEDNGRVGALKQKRTMRSLHEEAVRERDTRASPFLFPSLPSLLLSHTASAESRRSRFNVT